MADDMILEIIIAFLLLDGILACLVWLLLADDLAAPTDQVDQADADNGRLSSMGSARRGAGQ